MVRSCNRHESDGFSNDECSKDCDRYFYETVSSDDYYHVAYVSSAVESAVDPDNPVDLYRFSRNAGQDSAFTGRRCGP